tara:strand:- start:1216 stop:1521 length:306 start_codon:yes stop_codon:yes gene_type:complete
MISVFQLFLASSAKRLHYEASVLNCSRVRGGFGATDDVIIRHTRGRYNVGTDEGVRLQETVQSRFQTTDGLSVRFNELQLQTALDTEDVELVEADCIVRAR